MSAPTPLASLPPIPRPVEQRSRAAAFAIWVPRLLTLPHLVTGVVLLFVMFGALLWVLFGRNLEADVLRTFTTRGKSGPVCQAVWDYEREGVHHRGTDTIPCALRESLSARGAFVPVRALRLGSFEYASLWMPVRPTHELIMFPFVFGLFWNGMMGFLIWSLYLVPARQRRAVETGEAVIGVLTRKYTRQGRGVSRYLDYTFRLPGGEEHTGKALVLDKARWEAAQQGDPLLILYVPDKPKYSVAYDFSPYRVRATHDN
jgi:hypothetical protein